MFAVYAVLRCIACIVPAPLRARIEQRAWEYMVDQYATCIAPESNDDIYF